MNDPRLKDSIRRTTKLIEGQSERIKEMDQNIKDIKKILHSVKKATVRKYKKK